jgi:hypothetical protein
VSEEALPVAIEARELGKSAHKRLDGINGSIDRLGGKVDNVDAKLDQVLLRLAREDGAKERNDGFLASRWRVIGLVALIFTSAVFYTAVEWIARGGHP